MAYEPFSFGAARAIAAEAARTVGRRGCTVSIEENLTNPESNFRIIVQCGSACGTVEIRRKPEQEYTLGIRFGKHGEFLDESPSELEEDIDEWPSNVALAIRCREYRIYAEMAGSPYENGKECRLKAMHMARHIVKELAHAVLRHHTLSN